MSAILLVLALAGYTDPTNVELAEEALLLACLPVPDSLAAMGIGEVSVVADGSHEGGWFVVQSMTALLAERGIAVTGGEEGRGSVLQLRVRPMELRVSYGSVSRPWVVGAKRVERIAAAEISTQLVDSGGTVLMTLRSSGTAADEISWNDADALAGSDSWNWLTAELPEGGGGGILEPIIVTGVVASLVYLFYSSRAD